MFTLKANSKQKCVKKTQERETRDVVTVQLAPASKSLSMASWTTVVLAMATKLLAMASYDR